MILMDEADFRRDFGIAMDFRLAQVIAREGWSRRALAPQHIGKTARGRADSIDKFFQRSVPHQFTAVLAATGPEIDQIICGANDLFLMLDHQQGIALVAQIVHHANEPPDIARVQADARFVHDKEGVDERCSEAGGEVHALDFAAAQRARRAIEGEITDADLAEVIQARADFVTQHLSGFVSG